MVKQFFRYGKLIAPRVALAFGAFAVTFTSSVMADHITPGACAPACATPPAACAPECATPCAPACEAPVTCAPECATPPNCAPECATPDACAPACTDVACGEEEEDTCCDGDGYYLFGKDAGIKIGGWTQIGYHSDNDLLFNRHPDQLNLHQQWLYVEKIADGSKGFDWGFRADILYGVDAQDTQAFGNNPGEWDFQNGWDHGIYGWAMPQLYAEVATGDLSVKVGHFYTISGYEVVGAPGNFFYSHAFTMYNSEPFTHTGVLATYKTSDELTVFGGYTLGWDTGFDQNDGGSNFLGGATYAVNDATSLTYMTTIGDFGWREEGYHHCIIVNTALTDDLTHVFQTDLTETNQINDPTVTDGIAHQYSFVNYLLYTVSDQLKVGGRAEWWKNGDTSWYEVTGGANIFPTASETLRFRPEIRHQWAPGLAYDETIFGVDAIWMF